MLGFLVAKRFHGRSIKMTYILLIVISISDTMLFITRRLDDDEINDHDHHLKDFESLLTAIPFCTSSILIFLVYFLVCMLGIINLVKTEQL